MSVRSLVLMVMVAALVAPAMARGQSKGDSSNGSDRHSRDSGGGRGGGERGGRGGGFDPSQYRERRMSEAKEKLAASDDEWKVIEPKLQKVMDAQREMMMSMFGGRFGGGRDGSSDTVGSTVQKAQHDLQQALDNKDATAEEIAGKLTAL